jgi:NADH-quinone oxidoreductase subunit E
MSFPGVGIAKGMATTFRNFFAPKVTRQYPEERPQIPDRWRGRLDLIYDPFGEHKCEVCFQCAQVCPVEAIDMSGFDTEGNRIRYGMPEIYDERRDANAYRRAGLPARPMRNAARWDEAIDTAFVDGVIDGYGGRPEALVAIFGAIADRYGYLPERALRRVSDRMSIHWAQVFGAAGLGGFRLLPVEGHLVTVCDCAACRFAGGDRILRAITDELGIVPGSTTADGRVTLEVRSDVGSGAISPAMRIDTLVYGPLTVDKALHVLAQRRAAVPGSGRAKAGAGTGGRGRS